MYLQEGMKSMMTDIVRLAHDVVSVVVTLCLGWLFVAGTLYLSSLLLYRALVEFKRDK